MLTFHLLYIEYDRYLVEKISESEDNLMVSIDNYESDINDNTGKYLMNLNVNISS